MLQTEKEELYTVYDHNNGQFHDFYSKEDMINTMSNYCYRKYGGYFTDMVKPNFNFEIVEVRTHHWDLLAPTKAKSLYVVDFDGNFVDITEKYDPYRYRYKKYENQHYLLIEARNDQIESNLVIKNNNVDKIKKSHARKIKHSSWIGEFYYTRVIRGSHRRVHTRQIYRNVAGVLKDEGEPVFRGKQCNLPTYWDDLPLGVWKSFKSWKHNSKRKKQWKIKG